METKVISAVLLTLLVIAVGMDVYGMNIGDITGGLEYFDDIGGLFGRVRTDGEPAGTTNVTVNIDSYTNLSDVRQTGSFKEIEVRGGEIETIIESFSISSEHIYAYNVTGTLEKSGENFTVEGSTDYMSIGGNEFSSEEHGSFNVVSVPDYIFVSNIVNADIYLQEASGSVSVGDQYMEFSGTEFSLEKFSGTFESRPGEGELELDGNITEGMFGEEGSRTRFGDY